MEMVCMVIEKDITRPRAIRWYVEYARFLSAKTEFNI